MSGLKGKSLGVPAIALAAFAVGCAGQALLNGGEYIVAGLAGLVVGAGLLIASDLGSAMPGAFKEPVSGERIAAAPTARERAGRDWWWGALALAVLLIGAGFRLRDLDTQPWGIWFDEAQNGVVAKRILEDPSYRPVFVGEWSQLPALFFYAFALGLKVFGLNITALRLVTTIAGVLTVAFVYGLARELFDRRVAILAAFLLAVMRWHVNFSRFAMHGIFMPLCMTGALCFLVRGLRRQGWCDFMVAGLLVGAGLQGYFAFLLVPAVLTVYLVHRALIERTNPRQRLVHGVGAVAVIAVVVYAPVAIWAYAHPEEFGRRLGTVSVTRGQSVPEIAAAVARNTMRHVFMFNLLGDRNGRHNLPGLPMVDSYTGFLLVLGIGYAAWYWRHSGCALLLIWMAVVMQAGIWSMETEAPQAYRTIGLTPAVAMLAALPLALLWRQLDEAHAGRGARVFVLIGFTVIGGILLRLGWQNYTTYFDRQLPSEPVWSSYSPDATFAGHEVARLGGAHNVYLSPLIHDSPVVTFLAPDVPPPSSLDLARDLPLAAATPAVFVLAASERAVFDLLKRYYPNGRFQEFRKSRGSSPVAFEAIVGADDVRATQGLAYRYAHETSVRSGRLNAAIADWSAGGPLPFPFDAEWNAVLKVPASDAVAFEAYAPGMVELQVDGETVATGNGSAASRTLSLSQGLHAVRLSAAVNQPGRLELRWGPRAAEMLPVGVPGAFSVPVVPQGLEGQYRWESAAGAREFRRVDAVVTGYWHVLPLPVPFSVAWRGTLHVPVSGACNWLIDTSDTARVTLDGRPLLVMTAPGEPVEATAMLEAGPHTVEISFQKHGSAPMNLELFWAPGAGPLESVPASAFSPGR